MSRLIALVPNQPGVAPGQRFRVEAWAEHLRGRGWQVDLYAFEDERLHRVIYEPGRTVEKATALLACFRQQFQRVRRMPACDAVLIYREAAMVGPAVIERLARRVDAPMIFDLDDPTFVPYRSPTSGWWSLLKVPKKTQALFAMADQVIAVNRRIGDYAASFNPSVTIVPNFVDTDWYQPARAVGNAARDSVPTMVWSGSHTTAPNLHTIAPVLRRLQAERRCALRLVCDRSVELAGVVAEERAFSPANQVRDLHDCHIGLLPVNDLPWNQWKSFFKVVQYMAVGLPVVARRIGSNGEMIADGQNGFLVNTDEEWFQRLRTLIDDPDQRAEMGRVARQTVLQEYSATVQLPRIDALFTAAATRTDTARRIRHGEADHSSSR